MIPKREKKSHSSALYIEQISNYFFTRKLYFQQHFILVMRLSITINNVDVTI